MLRLGVIILNYRTPSMTIDCLTSLAPQMRDTDDRQVLVVDNASGDDSVERIEQAVRDGGWGRWASVIESPRNDGFAAGNNLGVQSLNAAAYLLLNSDTIVRDNALDHLLDAMKAHPDAGLIGPRLEDQDGTAQVSAFRDRTPISELLGAAGSSLLDRMLRRWVVRIAPSDEPMTAQWLSFACVLIRREVFDAIGPMDDDFFMFFEDIDFARRARKAGWSVRYEPSARVVHLRGGSSEVKSKRDRRERAPAYYYASRSRYFAKHFGGVFGVCLANVMWLIGRSISRVIELLSRRPPFACEREARDNWTNWRRPLRRANVTEGGGA